jgi:hypothetical protein
VKTSHNVENISTGALVPLSDIREMTIDYKQKDIAHPANGRTRGFFSLRRGLAAQTKRVVRSCCCPLQNARQFFGRDRRLPVAKCGDENEGVTQHVERNRRPYPSNSYHRLVATAELVYGKHRCREFSSPHDEFPFP